MERCRAIRAGANFAVGKCEKCVLRGDDEIARKSLSLPIYSHMSKELVNGICEAIERVHARADEVRAVLTQAEEGGPR